MNFKHGMRHTPEYAAWHSMKQRCSNPNLSYYPRYGGRGIRVCRRWVTSFEHFFSDVGARPSKQHSLERINNNGNYTPKNTTWATAKQQSNNMRSNAIYVFRGMRLTLSELSDFAHRSVSYNALRQRLWKGWSVRDAMNTPIMACYNRHRGRS